MKKNYISLDDWNVYAFDRTNLFRDFYATIIQGRVNLYGYDHMPLFGG